MIKRDITSKELADLVVEGMLDKKGHEIVQLDLRGIHNSVVDYFVICHATSSTQAEALAESVEVMVKQQTGQNPKNIEGKQHAEWILIDYFDVVVHIFLDTVRGFYKLESLWADAKVIHIQEQ